MSTRDLINAFGASLNEEQTARLVSDLDPSQKLMLFEILRLAKQPPTLSDEQLTERVRIFVDWARSRVAHCERRRTELRATEALAAGRVDRGVEIACYETEAATLVVAIKQLGFAP